MFLCVVGCTKGGLRKALSQLFADTHVAADCVKLRLPLFNQSLVLKPGRELWLTKKNARTRRARARNRQTANTAVLHVKGPATPSNSIVIAATRPARETSKLSLEALVWSSALRRSLECQPPKGGTPNLRRTPK